MSPVEVNYRKFDGSLHWTTTLNRLGEDEYGVWLGSPPGGRWRRDNGPWVPVPRERLLVVPRDRWWTARFMDNPDYHTSLYADVTMIPEWTRPDRVDVVDLDLDVVKAMRTGEVSLIDEDEFAEHQVRYGYPEDVIAAATESAQWLLKAVAAKEEPFGVASDAYRLLLNAA